MPQRIKYQARQCKATKKAYAQLHKEYLDVLAAMEAKEADNDYWENLDDEKAHNIMILNMMKD